MKKKTIYAATEKYSKSSIAMHWLVVLLMIGTYAFIELRHSVSKGEPCDIFKDIHYWLRTAGVDFNHVFGAFSNTCPEVVRHRQWWIKSWRTACMRFYTFS